MAKDLVRTRRQIQKFYSMKTQLQAVGLRIQVKKKKKKNCTLEKKRDIHIKLDPKLQSPNVGGHARSNKGNGLHESTNEFTKNTANHDGIRKGK